MAPEGAQLIASALPVEVVDTILQSRAHSTRKVYALKWKFFTSWCRVRQQDPVNCPVGTVLEYLQARFSTGVSHSTLKVHVAALSAYHSPFDGNTVDKQGDDTLPPRCAEDEAASAFSCPHVGPGGGARGSV